MMIRLMLSLGVLCCLLSQATSVVGQTTEPQPRLEFERVVNPFQEEAFRDKLRTSQALVRQHNYLDAAELLESLFAEQPRNDVVGNQLRNCYDRLKAYDKLLWLAKQRIELQPDRMDLHIELARVRVIQGDHDLAQQSYRQALKLARKDQEIESVLSGMVGAGYTEEASRLIDSLLPLSERPYALLLQRGIMLEGQKEFGRAALEYLSILNDTTRLVATAERRLLDLLKFETSSVEVEQTLMDQADSLNSVRGLHLLANHYLTVGQFETAFEMTVRQDSLEDGQGCALVSLMTACRDRRLHESAIYIGRYIIASYPTSPSLTQAYFTLGDALARTGEYDSALSVFDAAFGWLPLDREKADALYAIGTIYLDLLNNPRAAQTYFDSVIANYSKGISYLRATVRRPHCYLRLGELQIADSLFGDLIAKRLTDDLMEEVEYYRGLIRFCRSEFDSADVVFKRLMVSYPRGLYVNDALRLQLAMDRAKDAPELLRAFARAVLYGARRMTDSTLAALEDVVGYKDQTLADLALYRSLEIYQTLDDTASVLSQAARLSDEYPESYYTPYGLKATADILFESSKEQAEAREIYRQLLQNHPNYPFAGDIRRRLRELGSDA